MQRRRLLFGLGISALMTPLLVKCGNPAKRAGGDGAGDSTDEQEASFLFVHSAGETSLSDGVLRMGGIGASTIYFSDRPERIAGQLPTDEFVANWGHGGKDSFESDPPNATLSILSGPEPQEIVVVLKSPRLADGILSYEVEVLEGKETAVGDASSLFIDVIGRPLTPLSVAGGRRRVRRRTRRRNS